MLDAMSANDLGTINTSQPSVETLSAEQKDQIVNTLQDLASAFNSVHGDLVSAVVNAADLTVTFTDSLGKSVILGALEAISVLTSDDPLTMLGEQFGLSIEAHDMVMSYNVFSAEFDGPGATKGGAGK